MPVYTNDASSAQRKIIIEVIKTFGGVPTNPKESGYAKTAALAKAVRNALNATDAQLAIWVGRQEQRFSAFLAGEQGKKNESEAFSKWISRVKIIELNVSYCCPITPGNIDPTSLAPKPVPISTEAASSPINAAKAPEPVPISTEATSSPINAAKAPELGFSSLPEPTPMPLPLPSDVSPTPNGVIAIPNFSSGVDRQLLIEEITHLIKACHVRGDPAIKALLHQKVDLL